MARPRKYKSAKQLESAIDDYFANLEPGYVPTMEMMCVKLDICDETLRRYRDDPEFCGPIKKAENKVKAYKIEALNNRGNVTGIIFDLKNNYGWSDKIEQKTEVNATMSIEELFKDVEQKAL